MQRIIIFSHGFGVRFDDRGLFTDISQYFSDIPSKMFDYNQFDTQTNTLIATPLDAQAKKLQDATKEYKLKYPDAVITLICHSQGCIAAALAKIKGVNNTIFIASPAQFLGIEKKDLFARRSGTIIEQDGVIRYPRSDGSTTIIKEDYWKSRENIHPIKLYNQLSEHTTLTIIKALQDEVLTETNFTGLSKNIRLMELKGDHNFSGKARPHLLALLKTLL